MSTDKLVEISDSIVDLSFRLRGTMIAADHGYSLFSAISRHLPDLHGDESVGIHPISGQLVGGRQLALTPGSRLVLRLPVTSIPSAIKLAGRRLEVDGNPLLVGVPTVRPLRPVPALQSRLVVIRGFMETGSFLEAVNRQLEAQAISGTARLVTHRRTSSIEAHTTRTDAYVRRTLRIRDKEIVGFALHVEDLSPPDSIRLQSRGLGGRRRFGCGILLPADRAP